MEYICKACGAECSSERGLNIHISRKHSSKDKSSWPACQLCGHQYSSLKNGICGNCDFRINGKLKECKVCHEMKLFHSNRQKMCSDCKTKLEAERKTETEARKTTPVTCDICGLECTSSRSLNRHKTVKHKDYSKDDSWSECKNCHKKYKELKDGLCGHCNLNINGKDAVCEQCHRQVKFYSNRQKICSDCMQKNIDKHEADKVERNKPENLVCPTCDRQLTSYRGYKEHIVVHEADYVKRQFSESTKRKMSESGLGRKHKIDTRMKMRYSKLLHSVGKKNADILFDKNLLEQKIDELTVKLDRKPSISDVCECLDCYSQAVYNALSRNGFLESKIDVNSNHSHAELEVLDFVKMFDQNAGPNRKVLGYHQEIDIYSAKHNFGIEFDGSFWHSIENAVPKQYHLKKTNRCCKLGIRLVHIIESEWCERQEALKSLIEAIMLDDAQSQRKIELDNEWAKLNNNKLIVDRMKSDGSEWLDDGWHTIELLPPVKVTSLKWHIWNSGYAVMTKD